MSRNVLYYGKDEPLPGQQPLRAGPLSLVYEGGDLRYIRLGEREILRRIYVAVRDHNWGTVLPRLSDVQMDIDADSFRITYGVEHRQGDVDFCWRGTIIGDDQGTITFSMDGRVRSTFRRNRVGLCVLHPMECAGLNCRIEHVDGGVEESAFPRHIAPQFIRDGLVKPVHPFEEIRSMEYEAAPGLRARLRFEGEIFEMEDQRNWTDASYKTYGTPLRLPFPVEVEAGTEIAQSVALTLAGEIPGQTRAGTEKLTLSIRSAPVRPLPRIGLGMASHDQPLSPKEVARLKALHLSHLRVDLRLSSSDYEEVLRRAAREADALGATLEVALHLSDAADDELRSLAVLLKEIRPSVGAWLIFHESVRSTSAKWIKRARKDLTGYDPEARIGSGTDAFFTELNRSRPPVEILDLVSYSLNPQVHASDNRSLIETLAAQATTVETARQFVGDLPLSVSPVTLKMRRNPNATGPQEELGPGELPAPVDERQMSLFGAVWTAVSLKYLGGSETQSLTYYETSGWRGVMEIEAGSPLPERFPSLPGSVFPLYHVLADVGDLARGEVLPVESSDLLQVDGLALRKDGRTRLLLANLGAEARQVTVHNLDETVHLRRLDETNAERAMQAPEAFRAEAGEVEQTSEGMLELDLLPYAVVRIDGGE